MQIAFYLLRTYWKPLAILVIAGLIFNAGYSRAKRACDAANLRSEIAELKRQSIAKTKVLEKAARDSIVRSLKIENLTNEVEAYEISIGENAECVLSDADARSLRNLR